VDSLDAAGGPRRGRESAFGTDIGERSLAERWRERVAYP
jgi:hypothetical protein